MRHALELIIEKELGRHEHEPPGVHHAGGAGDGPGVPSHLFIRRQRLDHEEEDGRPHHPPDDPGGAPVHLQREVGESVVVFVSRGGLPLDPSGDEGASSGFWISDPGEAAGALHLPGGDGDACSGGDGDEEAGALFYEEEEDDDLTQEVSVEGAHAEPGQFGVVVPELHVVGEGEVLEEEVEDAGGDGEGQEGHVGVGDEASEIVHVVVVHVGVADPVGVVDDGGHLAEETVALGAEGGKGEVEGELGEGAVEGEELIGGHADLVDGEGREVAEVSVRQLDHFQSHEVGGHGVGVDVGIGDDFDGHFRFPVGDFDLIFLVL
mmetsp:Transcript_31995/g.73566  ORF Transcript_31995/g.73566 Transcript_31995/m.73566 type:complete len:321 (+) Transcript_31995:2601-3563(+)